jgi:hypothetical protein
MADVNKTHGDSKAKIDTILSRAVSDETFREQLVGDFDSVIKEYELTPEDVSALSSIYDGMSQAGFIEVLDERANPEAAAEEIVACCCCCCPSCAS